ncbi:hypothetical protein WJX72_010608 [[Myrmecia] bisecta]|uniref:Nudix hydrolase domain-containing protein n=1 Tax=[Myrmecia] bisecta TaxID=41462 RepID=A0AAW1P752_9CHLO
MAAATEADPQSLAGPVQSEEEFRIVAQEQRYSKYLTLYNCRVRYPLKNGLTAYEEHEYDVIGHPQAGFHFTATFPFHPYGHGRKGGEVTILREYCQGVNQMLYSLPAGGFDPKKHQTYLECAQAELSEEAHLQGGEWLELLDPAHPGISEVKWCKNRFTPFLCISPEADCTPGIRDVEEFIEVKRLDLEEVRRLALSGDMLTPSIVTCFMAFDRLQKLGHL